MAVISTFQNRHFYLAKDYVDGTNKTALTDKGDIEVKVKDNELYFLYKGADTVLKSDRINLKNLDYAKAVKASAMADKMKKVELTLDPSVNSGSPISGQDYVLRISFRQFYGMSDQDIYVKDCAVHATSAMSASDFYKAMVDALNKAFSREVGANAQSNPYLAFSVDNTTTATKIIIEEKPQPWSLGVESQERVYFDVIPTTIYTGSNDVVWGVANTVTSTTTVNNGKKIADLEYFCMGERGDQYRNMGWPNIVPTEYMVDASKEYNVLELHFAFIDNGVNSYRSEKDITIAVPMGASGSEYDVINGIIGKINSLANLSIATLN